MQTETRERLSMESREAESASGRGEGDGRKDFFVSYTGADQRWAEWIAWCLEQAGYSVIIPAWDFPAGANFVYEMDQALKKAQRMIVVLSPAYLHSQYAFAEWAEMFRRDPRGQQRLLVPVQVQRCDVVGLLGSIVYIDLVEVAEQEARERLLTGVQQLLLHPSRVAYPGLPYLIPDLPDFPGALPAVWMLPFSSNPFFTGREEDLKRLAEALRRERRAALSQPAALSGLGGVGKTQLAVEYAYRYRQDYEWVLWTQADSREALISGFVQIAHELVLPQRDEKDQILIVRAVQRWLRDNNKWLFILDNADDLERVKKLLPPASPGGHILLTTRAQALGELAYRIEVEVLDEDQGALLLLRRAKRIKPDETLAQAGTGDIAEAKALAHELGELPLALDQAGAYIEETSCSLADYRTLYQTARKGLLQRRGGVNPDHPESVAVTFWLAFEKIERKSAAAADLLRLCAFLAADAIPEEIITQGAGHLGSNLAPVGQNPLLLNEAIAALRSYSLVQRDVVGKTLTVHRLVQAVLKDGMDEQISRQWAERAVRAVNEMHPSEEFANWSAWERLRPHVLVCTELIEREQMKSLEAARLLNQAGYYLKKRGWYAEVEPLYLRALAIREQQLGAEHPDTATSLNNLAELYCVQGKYEQAQSLYRRAISIDVHVLGLTHHEFATDLNNLAGLYFEQGKYEQAEPLLRWALMIREQQLGPEHPNTAQSLNNLARLYQAQGKYKQAESLYLQALTIREQQLGAEHPDVAYSFNNLAAIYYEQGEYERAEPLYKQALAIRERQLGPEHPGTARSLNNLAQLYYAQGEYEQAELLHKRALMIREQQLGPEHPDTANSLNNLAGLYYLQGKYEQAELLWQRALAIREQQLGSDHPDTATSLNNQAGLYYAQGEYERAEPLYQRVLLIWERQLGPEHPYTATSLNNLAMLYVRQGKYRQAQPLLRRALSIWERVLGEQHPNTIKVLGNYVALLHDIGRREEAQELMGRLRQASEDAEAGST
jgi:tetratricopeptide (TPR) repeat protein